MSILMSLFISAIVYIALSINGKWTGMSTLQKSFLSLIWIFGVFVLIAIYFQGKEKNQQ